jgi:hypothetical protein
VQTPVQGSVIVTKDPGGAVVVTTTVSVQVFPGAQAVTGVGFPQFSKQVTVSMIPAGGVITVTGHDSQPAGGITVVGAQPLIHSTYSV